MFTLSLIGTLKALVYSLKHTQNTYLPNSPSLGTTLCPHSAAAPKFKTGTAHPPHTGTPSASPTTSSTTTSIYANRWDTPDPTPAKTSNPTSSET